MRRLVRSVFVARNSRPRGGWFALLFLAEPAKCSDWLTGGAFGLEASLPASRSRP